MSALHACPCPPRAQPTCSRQLAGRAQQIAGACRGTPGGLRMRMRAMGGGEEVHLVLRVVLPAHGEAVRARRMVWRRRGWARRRTGARRRRGGGGAGERTRPWRRTGAWASLLFFGPPCSKHRRLQPSNCMFGRLGEVKESGHIYPPSQPPTSTWHNETRGGPVMPAPSRAHTHQTHPWWARHASLRSRAPAWAGLLSRSTCGPPARGRA